MVHDDAPPLKVSMEDPTVERWMALEMARLRESLVAATRPVSDLAREERPATTTRGGAAHAFDREVVRRIHDALSPLERRRVRLPVTFYVEHELPEDAYVSDEAALTLLQKLGELAPSSQLRDGRAWIGHARARAI